MSRISFKRYRFSPRVIQHAVWLYAVGLFILFRDIEEPPGGNLQGLDKLFQVLIAWEALGAVDCRDGIDALLLQ